MTIVLPAGPSGAALDPARLVARDEIATRVRQYGFGYVPDATLNQWIADEAPSVVLDEPWPERRLGVEGAAPLTVSFLGPIEQVQDLDRGRPLEPTTYADVADVMPGTGTPESYFVVPGESVIAVAPVGGVTIRVTHFSRAVWLNGGMRPSSGADLVLMPEEWVKLVVYRTVARCHDENGDGDQGTYLRQLYEDELGRAKEDLLSGGRDEADFIRLVVYEGY